MGRTPVLKEGRARVCYQPIRFVILRFVQMQDEEEVKNTPA